MAKKIGFALRLSLFLAILAAAFFFVWRVNVGPTTEGSVEVFFIETKSDANAILLKQGEAVILVDTGEEVDAPAITAFLQEQQVSVIDYLVLTHPDQDHIGGAPALLEQFEVRCVIQPYYAKENVLADALRQTIDSLGVAQIYPTRPRSFTCGQMQMTVYPPLEKHYRKDNNYSLALWIKHGKVDMAFAGDAEEKRLNELMQIHWPAVQLYQVAHHGRASRSSGLLIEQLRPQYAVITASDGDQAVQDALKQVGARIFYTGDGTQQFVSDGKTMVYVERRP